MTTNEQPRYTSIGVYIRHSPVLAYEHTMYRDKESALDVVREMKSRLGEPKVDFVESSDADVLHCRFKNQIICRVVFMKRELSEHIHCPTCGNAMKRSEANTSLCHGWQATWTFDDLDQVWRTHTITREVTPRD